MHIFNNIKEIDTKNTLFIRIFHESIPHSSLHSTQYNYLMHIVAIKGFSETKLAFFFLRFIFWLSK